jgi:hypothetical protein
MRTSRLLVGLIVAVSGALWAGRPVSAVTAKYNIRLGGVNILNTRSRGTDTIYAQITVSVNGRVVGTAPWNGTCSDSSCLPGRDMNNGPHKFGMAVSADTGPISDTDKVTWSYQVINSGHSNGDPTAKNYTDAANAVTSAGCQSNSNDDSDNSGWLCAGAKVGKALVGWLVANCDGPLAADSITMTGAQLYAKTQVHPIVAAHKNS